MSLALMSWAFGQPIEPGPKLVLLALADHANGQTGLCIPGQKLLAEQCSMSVRTVQRHIQTLEDAGLLRREARMRGEGRGRTSDRYYLGDQHDKTGLTRQDGTTNATNQDDQHDTVVVAEPEENRKEEPIAAAPRKKEPDLLFEAVATACKIDWTALTPSGRGPINRAVKELRDIGVTPDQVGGRAAAYRRTYPDISLTPTALAKHWAALTPAGSPKRTARPSCEWCDQPLDDHDQIVCEQLGRRR
jgi:DNA-binding transcriptional ArsR family regulator